MSLLAAFYRSIWALLSSRVSELLAGASTSWLFPCVRCGNSLAGLGMIVLKMFLTMPNRLVLEVAFHSSFGFELNLSLI
jgi:hypothetical protein